MTSSIHELSDNIGSHEKQEQRDSHFQPPIPSARNYESIVTSLVYSDPGTTNSMVKMEMFDHTSLDYC
jgi:nuclear transcription factor Y alpha